MWVCMKHAWLMIKAGTQVCWRHTWSPPPIIPATDLQCLPHGLKNKFDFLYLPLAIWNILFFKKLIINLLLFSDYKEMKK